MSELNGQAEWDQRYSADSHLWSGQPNGQLVTEARDLRAGRALDVGCGEGADAIWLAQRGWDVTALDVSRVAVDRAAAQAERIGVSVHWLHAGLVDARLAAASFDLVSAQYPALRRTDGAEAEHALIDAVAPNGMLLIVHHSPASASHAEANGFHPDDYVGPSGVAALLLAQGDGGWVIEVDESRPRQVTSGAGAGHSEDIVLRARRSR